jgi:hypothetical protein
VASAGSVLDTVLLGRRDTVALAAFTVAMAAYAPVVAAVTGDPARGDAVREPPRGRSGRAG